MLSVIKNLVDYATLQTTWKAGVMNKIPVVKKNLSPSLEEMKKEAIRLYKEIALRMRLYA
jgi:hypothetical protein